MGTVFNYIPEFYQKCFKAFNDNKYRIMMSVGDKITHEDLGDIPDNFTIVASFPQTKVLSRANVFLSHGGMNSSMEGLYYEVPFVLNPQQNEQCSNANQLVGLGVGQMLTPEYTSEEIRQKVDEVLINPFYAENLAIYGPQVRQAGGAKKGVEIIEQILQNQ